MIRQALFRIIKWAMSCPQKGGAIPGPLHPNCRCTLEPMAPPEKEEWVHPGRRPLDPLWPRGGEASKDWGEAASRLRESAGAPEEKLVAIAQPGDTIIFSTDRLPSADQLDKWREEQIPRGIHAIFVAPGCTVAGIVKAEKNLCIYPGCNQETKLGFHCEAHRDERAR